MGRPGVPRRARRHPARLRRPPVDPHRVPQPRRASSGCACCSSARTSTTPARTRSTTCSARRCSPSGWARPASSPRPAPASTAWPRATAAALLGLECKVYMGAVDVERQALNVFRMRLLGAEVEAGRQSGSRTLKDAVNEAMRDWVATVERHPLLPRLGDGPAPVPVDGARVPPGDRRRGPRAVPRRCSAATPTSSSRASAAARTRSGIFSGFVDTDARLVGVEPAGGAAVGRGVPGVVHGMRSYLMQDEYGQVEEAQSISAGLDYPGVGPEHSYLASIGRAEYPCGHRRRGDRGVPAAGAHRGDHPGPRAGARRWPGSSARRASLAGPDRAA